VRTAYKLRERFSRGEQLNQTRESPTQRISTPHTECADYIEENIIFSWDGICQLGLADGSTIKLKRFPDEFELKSLIIPDDGRLVEFEKLKMPKGKS
jgi:hypothetical protein